MTSIRCCRWVADIMPPDDIPPDKIPPDKMPLWLFPCLCVFLSATLVYCITAYIPRYVCCDCIQSAKYIVKLHPRLGSDILLDYFYPKRRYPIPRDPSAGTLSTPSIPPGSVNEYQLYLRRQRQVWLIPIADERVGVQVKL